MTTTDVNGNIVQAEPDKKIGEYKIELAWFNIVGFIYLHYVTIVNAREIVAWNKTLVFGKLLKMFKLCSNIFIKHLLSR